MGDRLETAPHIQQQADLVGPREVGDIRKHVVQLGVQVDAVEQPACEPNLGLTPPKRFGPWTIGLLLLLGAPIALAIYGLAS